MRPILKTCLTTLLLSCSGCAADEFSQCLGAVSFHDYEIPTLTAALVGEEPPSAFVAAKGVSVLGLYYLVVANYEDHSVATMYRSGLGVRFVDLSLQGGRDLHKLATSAISETPASQNKGAFDLHNCHFVRAGSGNDRVEGRYVNPSRDESGDELQRLFYEIDSLLDAAYGEITFDSYVDEEMPMPPNYSEDDLAEIIRRTSRNVFGELDDLWSKTTD